MAEWIELTSRKEEFTKIVKLLVGFDETTGRYAKYDNQSSHWLRKAVSVAEPEALRVLLKHLGGFVYSVVTEQRTESGFCVTCWVLEDGIRSEREDKRSEPRHPVHSIVCVSDLYQEGKPADLAQISSETANLLTGRS